MVQYSRRRVHPDIFSSSELTPFRLQWRDQRVELGSGEGVGQEQVIEID